MSAPKRKSMRTLARAEKERERNYAEGLREIQAMGTIASLMLSFSPEAQRRMASWLMRHIETGWGVK